jgi:hypothetical protein
MTDKPSREEEEHWCADRRAEVVAYLDDESVRSSGVGEWPAWHVVPYVSIWAVGSLAQPGWVGWWAVSGDFPTDYVACSGERHPRQALHDIGRRWQLAAEKWTVGEPVDGFDLRDAAQEPELASLLESRAKLFLDLAADESLWAD